MKFPYLTLDKKKSMPWAVLITSEIMTELLKCRIMTKKSNKLGKLVLVAPDKAPPLCHL